MLCSVPSYFRDEPPPPFFSENAIAFSKENVPATIEELKKLKKVIKETLFIQVEREFVLRALQTCDWNVSAAARMVGMQRSNFHSLMRKTGVKKESETSYKL